MRLSAQSSCSFSEYKKLCEFSPSDFILTEIGPKLEGGASLCVQAMMVCCNDLSIVKSNAVLVCNYYSNLFLHPTKEVRRHFLVFHRVGLWIPGTVAAMGLGNG